MKKILSIDGGGIRGIIPGQVLLALERKLQIKTGDPKARVSKYFDFLAGTSTGGILVCLLLCPDENDPLRPNYSAEEVVNLYKELGGKIFRESFLNKIFNHGSIIDEKYSADPLENILKEYFGETKLSELLKPCIITAYDIHDRRAHFFSQQDHKKKGSGRDFLLRDVCRATSAAPTYFEAALVRSLSGVSYPLIDGGIFANNPSLCAYSEVRNAVGQPSAKDMFVVSIGTGSQNISYDYKRAKHWGAVGWIKPVIDIMMSGASETTNYHMLKMFAANGNQANYTRIQPANLNNADTAMDNAGKENIQALAEVGIRTSEECEDQLDRIIDILLQGEDPVEFV